MKKEIATRWVKALRSGKYKQGKCALKYKTKAGVTRHCCLGVLCELYAQDRKRTQKKALKVSMMSKDKADADTPRGSTVYSFGPAMTTLPETVRKWAGLIDGCGEFIDNDGRGETLTELNDGGKSFKQIADIIEKNIENL